MRFRHYFYMILATSFLLAISGCQCTRQIKCANLSSPESCIADADCQAVTFPSCSGEKCQTTYCQPSIEKKSCIVDEQMVARSCPRDSRTFTNGSVPAEIVKLKWAFEKLSPFAKALAGKKISKTDLDQLTPTDSDALCQPYPKESCKLAWSESRQAVVCEIGPAPCEDCLLVSPKFKCAAINKCNGVICL